MRLTKQIGAKLRNASGVSMVLALGIMMVVSIVCVSTLKVASSAPRAAYTQQDLEQSYLAATSAAKLVKHIFDTDETKALRLLQEMDKCSTNNGLDRDFSKEFQVQLSRTGVDATILNKFNIAKVTLTKTNDGTVTVSVSGSGYPTSLPLSVDTVVWPSYPDTETALARTTYPKNYTGTITPPENVRQYYENLSYESGSEIFFFDTWNVTGTTVSPVFTKDNLCRLIWLKSDGTELEHKDYGANQTTPTDPAVPEKASAASDYYEYRGSWTQVSSVTDAQGILVTTKRPTYETIAKQVYKIKWLDGDNTILDTKTTTANAQEPVTTETPVKGGVDGFYPFIGWNEGSMSGAIKTYTPQFETTASITTKTVIWLDGDGSTLETKYYPEGGTEPTLSEGKSPTKAADDTWWSYTFTSWDSGTITGNVKTYTPKFTGSEHKYITKLMDSDGVTVRYRHERHVGEIVPDDFFNNRPLIPEGCTFSKWDDGTTIDTYTTAYNPVFTATITWCDYTRGVGNAPDSSSPLVDSETYTVGGTVPTRAAPEGYRDELYVYTGTWTTSDTGYSKTYTATFTPSNRENYVARWRDSTGNTLQTTYIVSGNTPTCTTDGWTTHTWKCASDTLQTGEVIFNDLTNSSYNGTYSNIYLRIYEPVAPEPEP